MPRAATSPAVRAQRLRSVTLPKAKRIKDRRLSANEMADLLEVHVNSFRKWRRGIPGFAESGCFIEGDRGIGYEFDPVATVQFLIKHYDAEAKALTEKVRRLGKALGADDELGGLPEEMTPGELKTLLDVSMRFQDLRERQGSQVPVNTVRSVLVEMTSRMREAGLRAVQEADPNGRWSAEMRTIAEDLTRTILLEQKRAADHCLEELRGRTAGAS